MKPTPKFPRELLLLIFEKLLILSEPILFILRDVLVDPSKNGVKVGVLTPAVFRLERGISQWAIRTFYSNNTFKFCDQGKLISSDRQAHFISIICKHIGQNANLIRHVEIPFPTLSFDGLSSHQTKKIYLATLKVLEKSCPGLSSVKFRIGMFAVATARNNEEDFDPAVDVVDKYLQQHALTRTICSINGKYMLPHIKDKLITVGWRVVEEDDAADRAIRNDYMFSSDEDSSS